MKDEKLVKVAKLLEQLCTTVRELVEDDVETSHTEREDEVPSFVEVRGVLAEISRSGKTSEMKALLSKYGAVKLSDVKEEDYSSLLKDAKELSNA